jgi:hypothetical protein
VQARALGKPVWTYDQLFRYWSLRKDGQGEIAAREAIRGSVLPREPVAARVPVTPQGRYAMTAREAIRARLEQNARELRAAQEAPKTVAPHPSAHPLSNGRRAIDL